MGCLISPYIRMGLLPALAAKIDVRGSSFTQDELEQELLVYYGPSGMAPMVTGRYPLAPVIKEYKDAIAKAIDAHFFGPNHIAVDGPAPVIENF